MALIKWLPLLLMIARTEEKEPWDYSVGEEMLKSILESCYGGNSSPNPVVIFGDFNKFINGVSIIQINDFLNVEDYKEHGSLKFKASSVVLMEEPSEQLLSNLLLLRETELWDNMVPFFIIGAKTAPCTNSRWILGTMWGLEILRAIYICSKFINDGAGIYTLNPITNYAPYPWTKISEEHNLTIFYRNFDANISCTNLTYDKTEILSGYNIVAVGWALPGLGWVPGYNYFERYAQFSDVSIKALRTIIIALNASGQIEVEKGMNSMKKRWLEGSADIMTILFTHHIFWAHPNLFPLLRNELVIVVKLKAEVSTLKKIHQLWSTPVLIAAAFALAFLFLILLIKRRSFGSALLDFTRFLIYTSIQIDNRYQSFRIYFTTMLIFIVISNGVFQGKIAAFLTTRERSSVAKSIHELIGLGYEMYTLEEHVLHTKESCPRCKFKGVRTVDECMELVLNGTKNLCLIDKWMYESKYILLDLDRIGEPLSQDLVSFKCRYDWPLRDRFNNMIMRIVESGLTDYWQENLISVPEAKRQSMEDERSSAQYRPVALMKLDFAFQLLAAGLSVGTIVFFLELCWARYVNP